MKKAIELVETRRNCAMLERTPRYAVMFNGKEWDELYFNTRGYVGYLPAPNDAGGEMSVISLNIGEKAIGAYRKEVAALNREWAAITQRKEQVVT